MFSTNIYIMFSTNIMLLKLKVCAKRFDNMKLLLLLLLTLIGKMLGISDTCQNLYVTCRHTCQNPYVTCRHTCQNLYVTCRHTCQNLYVTCRHTCQNLYVTCRHTYSAPLRYIAIKTNSTQNRTFKRSSIAQI